MVQRFAGVILCVGMFLHDTVRFPSFRFFPNDLVNLRWLLNEGSAVPFRLSWSTLVSDPLRRSLQEMTTMSNLKWNFKVLILSLVVKKTESFIARQIHKCIGVEHETFVVDIPPEMEMQ